MVRDIIDINDFTVLIEQSQTEQMIIDECAFEEPVIGVAFYGAGDVQLTVEYLDKSQQYQHTKGTALAFFADDQVKFVHKVLPDTPLQCVCIITATKNLPHLPYQEGEIFSQFLHQLVHPQDHFVEGPLFNMSPEMKMGVDKIFNSPYEGIARTMFLRSQVIELLSHFFGQLSESKQDSLRDDERQKLFEAQEILRSNISTPPSLTELSRLIGLNSYKLKKNFKELFGVPVFKYLQNERLSKAYDLLNERNLSIQEAAWQVGYDSLSSFSNAFTKKYGFRPSDLRK